jgi:hypothetical protein
MRRCCAIGIAVIALAGLAPGCGGSGKEETVSTPSPKPPKASPRSKQAEVKALQRLRPHVLNDDELSGFHALRRQHGASAATWVYVTQVPLAEQKREAARLTQLGFVDGLEEILTPNKGGDVEAFSVVEQFGSDEAARSELAAQLQIAKRQGMSEFAVSAPPGARGFAEPGNDILAFADGRSYYQIGIAYPPDTARGGPNDLIRAAKRLYTRLHQT